MLLTQQTITKMQAECQHIEQAIVFLNSILVDKYEDVIVPEAASTNVYAIQQSIIPVKATEVTERVVLRLSVEILPKWQLGKIWTKIKPLGAATDSPASEFVS